MNHSPLQAERIKFKPTLPAVLKAGAGAVKTKKGRECSSAIELQSRPNWPSAVPIHCRLQYSDVIRPPYDALLHTRRGGRFSF